jgi:hypothetical protein
VIAGTHDEFQVFRRNKSIEFNRESQIPFVNFVYVTDPIQLKGISSPHGWFIGTWRDRQNIKQIVNALCVCYHSGLPDTLLDIVSETLG